MLQQTTREIAAIRPAHVVQNEILATLAPEMFERLRPHLKLVELRSRSIVNEQNRPVDAVHFIESGVVSRVTRTVIDGPVEVGIVGKFGFLGVSVVLGTMVALQRAVVLVPGQAFRISAADLTNVMQQAPEIREHLLRYVHTLMLLQGQVSLCNARHELEQRLARWLLLADDRMGGEKLPVTHDLLATALGVRRPGVTEALLKLEASGVVQRWRGGLRVIDRDALKSIVCECYRIIDERFGAHRALPHYAHTY